jgi:hypothetical protein
MTTLTMDFIEFSVFISVVAEAFAEEEMKRKTMPLQFI